MAGTLPLWALRSGLLFPTTSAGTCHGLCNLTSPVLGTCLSLITDVRDKPRKTVRCITDSALIVAEILSCPLEEFLTGSYPVRSALIRSSLRNLVRLVIVSLEYLASHDEARW